MSAANCTVPGPNKDGVPRPGTGAVWFRLTALYGMDFHRKAV